MTQRAHAWDGPVSPPLWQPESQRPPHPQRASMGSPTADEAPTLDRGAANEMRGPAPGIAPPPAVPVAVTIEAPPAPPSPDKPASAKPAAVPLPVPPLTAPSGRPQWRPGSVEDFLEREGVPAPLIEDCVRRIVAWRVTKLGRVLVDRRRRNRVERNMVEVRRDVGGGGKVERKMVEVRRDVGGGDKAERNRANR